MIRTRISAAVIVGALVLSSAAMAQAPSGGTTPPASSPSTMDKVKEMTRKEWNAAKAKWASEKDKWAACRREAKDKKLTLRQRWTYRVQCMTR